MKGQDGERAPDRGVIGLMRPDTGRLNMGCGPGNRYWRDGDRGDIIGEMASRGREPAGDRAPMGGRGDAIIGGLMYCTPGGDAAPAIGDMAGDAAGRSMERCQRGRSSSSRSSRSSRSMRSMRSRSLSSRSGDIGSCTSRLA